MERELLVTVLAIALGGAVVWAAAGLISLWGDRSMPIDDEAGAWLRLVAPGLAGLCMVVFLLGWALTESDPADEWIGWGPWAMAALVAPVLLRALLRAAASLYHVRRQRGLVATVGIVRPRVSVSDTFRARVSSGALHAALLHEHAHVEAKDPLRIWLAQIVSDLQWPLPVASRRLRRWLLSLELRRDQEALALGADPLDLAEAILCAAQLAKGSRRAAVARTSGSGEDLQLRIRRLVSGLTTPATIVTTQTFATPPSSWATAALEARDHGRGLECDRGCHRGQGRAAHAIFSRGSLASLMLLSLALGYAVGDALLILLPGIYHGC